MISSPTVLVLGAGASRHVGYPLGSELVRDIWSQRVHPENETLPNGWSKDDVLEFATNLRRSGYYSIDAYLEAESRHVPLGKYLIARRLKRAENLDVLFENAGWYQYLLNVLVGRGDARPEFRPENLSVITFNYDRSLEAYLYHALLARCKVSADQARDMLARIPIAHVHGILGSFPDFEYRATSDPNELLAVSNGIQIIHECEDESPAFQAARGLLQAAERIYFLGFGFHTDNVRRLGFSQETLKEKRVWCTLTEVGPIELKTISARLKCFGFPPGGDWFRPSDCNSFFSHVASLD